MNIPKFLEDLAIISKLGDNPNEDNGLTPSGLKAKFDEAALKLQSYINDVVVERINSIFALDAQAHEGMNMTGPINMNGQSLTGLSAPTSDTDAVPKEYADKMLPKTGGIVTGDIRVDGGDNYGTARLYSSTTGGGVEISDPVTGTTLLGLYGNGEGGNVRITSRDRLHHFELDAADNNLLRLYHGTNSGHANGAVELDRAIIWNGDTGIMTLPAALPIGSGGTGAKDATTARNNLGITPANIGALPSSGGTMSGDFRLGAGASETADIVFGRPTNNEYETRIDVIGNVLRMYCYDRQGAYSGVMFYGLGDGQLTLKNDAIVNPQMVFGTEYKLAEYYNGSPVYAKWVDFGSLPNNTYKSIPTGGVFPEKMVSISGFAYSIEGSYADFSQNPNLASACFVNSGGSLVVETTADRSGWTAKFLLKYIK